MTMMMIKVMMMMMMMMMTLIWCPEQGSGFRQQASQHPSCPVLPPSAMLKHLHHHHNHIVFVIAVIGSSRIIILVAHFLGHFHRDTFLCPAVHLAKFPQNPIFCESYHHRRGHIRNTCIPSRRLPHSGKLGLGNQQPASQFLRERCKQNKGKKTNKC